MDPVIRTHTKEDMSTTKERKQEDTMRKETDCNITPFIQSNPRFDQNSMRQMPIPN